jgi:hypothetical protein
VLSEMHQCLIRAACDGDNLNREVRRILLLGEAMEIGEEIERPRPGRGEASKEESK